MVLQRFGAGETFASGQSQALASVLGKLQGEYLEKMHAATITAAAAIQPEVAAAYMLKVIATAAGDKANIPSPWYPIAS